MKNKPFANGNCEKCILQNMCPAPKLNYCPEITHGIVWEMSI